MPSTTPEANPKPMHCPYCGNNSITKTEPYHCSNSLCRAVFFLNFSRTRRRSSKQQDTENLKPQGKLLASMTTEDYFNMAKEFRDSGRTPEDLHKELIRKFGVDG